MKIRCFPHSSCHASSGFTLLEVLVALLILAIGLLGLAGLQFSALRGNTQSYERSQALALINELFDRMRAHRVSAAEGRFNLEPFEDRGSPADCEQAPCTPEEAAEFELAQWLQRLSETLPGATASIQQKCAPDIPCVQRSTLVVRVLWDENRAAVSDASCPDAADFDPAIHLSCVQVSVSP